MYDKQLNNPALRQSVIEKNNGRCHLCGTRVRISVPASHHAAFQIDHSKAKSNGGTDHFNNLFPSCPRCNSTKGNRYTARKMRKLNGYQRNQDLKEESGLGVLAAVTLVVAIIIVANGNKQQRESGTSW